MSCPWQGGATDQTGEAEDSASVRAPVSTRGLLQRRIQLHHQRRERVRRESESGRLNRGDGVETIDDMPSSANSAEASVIVLGEGINPAEVKFRLGSLLIDLGNGDAIHLAGFDPENPSATKLFDSLQFADGTVLSFEDVIARGFDIDGTEDSDNGDFEHQPELVGTVVNDRMRGLGGRRQDPRPCRG